MRHRCPLFSSSVTLVTSSAMVAGTRACQSKAIFDGHKRVEAWFEPSRALRCGHAHLPHAVASSGGQSGMRAQIDITFEIYREADALASRWAGWSPRAGHISIFRWVTELRCGLSNVRATVILFNH